MSVFEIISDKMLDCSGYLTKDDTDMMSKYIDYLKCEKNTRVVYYECSKKGCKIYTECTNLDISKEPINAISYVLKFCDKLVIIDNRSSFPDSDCLQISDMEQVLFFTDLFFNDYESVFIQHYKLFTKDIKDSDSISSFINKHGVVGNDTKTVEDFISYFAGYCKEIGKDGVISIGMYSVENGKDWKVVSCSLNF